MKNLEQWCPTKFVLAEGRLTANRDGLAVSPSSILNVELLARTIGPAIRQHVRGRLVDLGCGAVPLYEAYRDVVDSVTCVDWPSGPHGGGHIDISADLNEPLPLADRGYDTVLLTDVLEHLNRPRELLHEVCRILAPGGMLIGSVPFMYWLHEEPHDYFRYTQHALRRMAEEAGLVVHRIEPYGGGTDVLMDVAAKLVRDLHWRLGPALARACCRFGLWLRETGLGRRLNAHAATLPIGYLMVLGVSQNR